MKDSSERLKRLDNDKLMEVVKNYRQYGYDEEIRREAITLLKARGISKEEHQLRGQFENSTYNRAQELYDSFNLNAKVAFVFYSILLFNNLLVPVLFTDYVLLQLLINVLASIVYFIFLVKSFIKQNQFYKNIKQDVGPEAAWIYWLVGMPLYLVMYFYYRNEMREKMKTIR